MPQVSKAIVLCGKNNNETSKTQAAQTNLLF
jgi:hypothetical protein